MPDHNFTRLLQAAKAGDNTARDRLLPQIYDELRKLASYQMSRERAGHTLQATALVSEAWLRMSGSTRPKDKTHFLALSAQTMRRVLVDHARAKRRDKRGGDQLRVTLTEWQNDDGGIEQNVLELHDALQQLAEFDERSARAIELLFFGGLTHEEIAAFLNVSRSTVFEDIKAAKAWLAVQLG